MGFVIFLLVILAVFTVAGFGWRLGRR